MPYTERQLHCLSAMGLVAWRARAPLGETASTVADGSPVGSDMPSVSASLPVAVAPDASPNIGADVPVESTLPAAPLAREGGGDVPSVEASDVGTVDAGTTDIGTTDAGATDSGTSGTRSTEIEAVDAEAARVATGDAGADGAGTAGAEPAGAGALDVAAPDAATSGAVPSGGVALEPLVAPALAAPLPREPSALAAWVPDQPLAPFTWKERRLTRVGRDDAPLLVIVERAPNDGLPLSGPAAELFERMLESIGQTRRDTCQCVLAADPQPGGDTVATLAGSHRSATLVLVQELDAALDADACRLPGETLGGPAWCLPHPEGLLARPLDKRRAWEILKAVRVHLPLLP